MKDPIADQSPKCAPAPAPPPPMKMMPSAAPQFHPPAPAVMPPPMHYYYNPYMLPPASYNLQPAVAAAAGGQFPENHMYHGYERNWSSGLFECFTDINTCLKTCICPCITFGQIAEILNEGQTIWYEPAILYTIVAMIGCFSSEVLPIHTTFLYTCLYRTKMRDRYGLRGSRVDDCCVHLCCEYCALCQEYRELEQHGFRVAIGWEKNKEREREAMAGYQYAPPMAQEMTR